MEKSEETLPDSKKNSLENSTVIQNILASSKKNLSSMEVTFLKMYVRVLEDSKRMLVEEFKNYKQHSENIQKMYQEKIAEQRDMYEDRVSIQRKIFQDKLTEQKDLYMGYMESIVKENLFHKQMLESADRTIKSSLETIANMSKINSQ